MGAPKKPTGRSLPKAPRSSNPQTNAFALVGAFLHRWAHVEAELRRAIGKALGLDATQTAIVGANISLKDKVHILRTWVNLSHTLRKERREVYDKLLLDVANYSGTRNMVAHDGFTWTATGNVSFAVVKAKGKFNDKPVVWNRDKFIEAYAKMDEFAREIAGLATERTSADLINELAKAMTSVNAGGPFAPTFTPWLGQSPLTPTLVGHPQLPRPLGLLGYFESSPEAGSQPDPEPKG